MTRLVVRGGNLVTPHGTVANGTIIIEDGFIRDIRDAEHVVENEHPGRRVIPAEGLYVLPGLISLYCCFLEKELFPRKGIEFPIERAIIQADKVMATSGIVKGYHAVGISNDYGNVDLARAIHESTDSRGLVCTHRLHLLTEKVAMPAARSFGHSGHILSILPGHEMVQRNEWVGLSFLLPKSTGHVASSGAQSLPEFQAIFESVHALALPTAAKSLGAVTIAKVPYLLSSPPDNSLKQAFADALVDVSVADCYAPSLLHACFFMDRQGLVPLHQAVNLASLVPAQMLGMGALEGSLDVGKTANLLVVEVSEETPQVVTTLIRGETVFSARRRQK